MIDTAPVGIAVAMDPECNYIWGNPEFAHMLGLTPNMVQAERKALAVRFADYLHFPGEGRTRPNERHVAPNHVKQLGKLINAGLAQQPADRGDPRVVFELEKPLLPACRRLVLGEEPADILPVQFVGAARVHAAELVQHERAVIPADVRE